jgi:hypothetical protein
MGGLIFVLGLAIMVIFKFDNIGTTADSINLFFTGIFGEARLLLPIICMYIGITAILSSKKKNVGAEILKGCLITTLASACIYAFTVDRYDLWTNPGPFINNAYKGAIEEWNNPDPSGCYQRF